MADEQKSAIEIAKEKESIARYEWLRAMDAFSKSLSHDHLELADQARIAWKTAEKKLAELEGRG